MTDMEIRTIVSSYDVAKHMKSEPIFLLDVLAELHEMKPNIRNMINECNCSNFHHQTLEFLKELVKEFEKHCKVIS